MGRDEDAGSALEAAIRDLKSTAEGNDLEGIRSKTQALAQASMRIGEAMYKAQAGGGAQPGGPGGSAGAGGPGGGAGTGDGEKVVDADFEEVDDQKKRGSA